MTETENLELLSDEALEEQRKILKEAVEDRMTAYTNIIREQNRRRQTAKEAAYADLVEAAKRYREVQAGPYIRAVSNFTTGLPYEAELNKVLRSFV